MRALGPAEASGPPGDSLEVSPGDLHSLRAEVQGGQAGRRGREGSPGGQSERGGGGVNDTVSVCRLTHPPAGTLGREGLTASRPAEPATEPATLLRTHCQLLSTVYAPPVSAPSVSSLSVSSLSVLSLSAPSLSAPSLSAPSVSERTLTAAPPVSAPDYSLPAFPVSNPVCAPGDTGTANTAPVSAAACLVDTSVSSLPAFPVSAASLSAPVSAAQLSAPACLVDASVYSRNRCFRLYGSAKVGKGVPLLPAHLSRGEVEALGRKEEATLFKNS
ncbi:hypothetical protein T492DRAFT_357798 [Pavlovales sp. CCMP2436]|nr:hypothetical protein T492DRAFT_357798 [Pavlovales sp. CCMP2436]